MARQPFWPKYQSDHTWTLGNIWTVTKPQLASLVVQAITTWPFVELELALVSGTLFRAEKLLKGAKGKRLVYRQPDESAHA